VRPLLGPPIRQGGHVVQWDSRRARATHPDSAPPRRPSSGQPLGANLLPSCPVPLTSLSTAIPRGPEFAACGVASSRRFSTTARYGTLLLQTNLDLAQGGSAIPHSYDCPPLTARSASAAAVGSPFSLDERRPTPTQQPRSDAVALSAGCAIKRRNVPAEGAYRTACFSRLPSLERALKDIMASRSPYQHPLQSVIVCTCSSCLSADCWPAG